MAARSSVPPRPGRAPVKAPKHLEPFEAALWGEIIQAHDFDDVAALALLRTCMESHQRARRCREAIDRDGEAIKDRFDQLKPHPLLAAERDARAAFLSAMKAVSLDLAGVD